MSSFISIVAVLGVGSIVAAFIGWRVSISNNRQAWINALRDDIATFLKDLETMHDVVDRQMHAKSVADLAQNELDRKSARVAILFVYWRIILRLNRLEQLHIELRQKLDALMLVESRTPDRTKVEEMVDLARKALKREWEVTKYGSMAGPVLWFRGRKEGEAMNWAKGFVRLWVVASAIWVVSVVSSSSPVELYHEATAPVQFSYKNNTIEFPPDTSARIVKTAIASFIREDRAKQPKNAFDQFDQTPDDEAASVVGSYKPKNRFEPIFPVVGWAVVPPLLLLVLGFSVGWIISGFRPKLAS